MASEPHLRSPGCYDFVLVASPFAPCCSQSAARTWCISTVTVPPALTGHFPATPLVPPALHTKSLLPTFVRGEFDVGMRMHVDACCDGQYHCHGLRLAERG